MNLTCKLIEKSFKDDSGVSRNYYVLAFNLIDGSTLEVSLKGDKAKLLLLSNKFDSKDDKMPDVPDIDWLNK